MPTGYGQFTVRRGNEDGPRELGLTHRIAWELAHGPIPNDPTPPWIYVCHRCDNRPCCNPYRCLFLGTAADNSADMVNKGRANSKLRREDIDAIRKGYLSGIALDSLAESYGVSLQTIRMAVNGRAWKNLDGCEPPVDTTKPRRRKLTREDAEDVRRLRLEDGLGVKEIAERFNITAGYVSHIALGRAFQRRRRAS